MGLNTSFWEADVEGSLEFTGLKPIWLTQQDPMSIIIIIIIMMMMIIDNITIIKLHKGACLLLL